MSGFSDKELEALRETGKTERFYAEKAGTRVPGIVRLVERLDAAEMALATAADLIASACAQSVDPLCADFMCDMDDWRHASEKEETATMNRIRAVSSATPDVNRDGRKAV